MNTALLLATVAFAVLTTVFRLITRNIADSYEWRIGDGATVAAGCAFAFTTLAFSMSALVSFVTLLVRINL